MASTSSGCDCALQCFIECDTPAGGRHPLSLACPTVLCWTRRQELFDAVEALSQRMPHVRYTLHVQRTLCGRCDVDQHLGGGRMTEMEVDAEPLTWRIQGGVWEDDDF